MIIAEKYSRYSYGDAPTVSRTLDGQSIKRKALTNKDDVRRTELTDEEFMMLPAELYGFSLADKLWRMSLFPC